MIRDEVLARIFLSTSIPDKVNANEPIKMADWFEFGRAVAEIASVSRATAAHADGEDVHVEQQDNLIDIRIGAGRIIATQREAEALLALLQSTIDGYTD